jgi:hypothetical protein
LFQEPSLIFLASSSRNQQIYIRIHALEKLGWNSKQKAEISNAAALQRAIVKIHMSQLNIFLSRELKSTQNPGYGR